MEGARIWRARRIAVLLAAAALCGRPLGAQFTTANLGGIIRDSSGAVVPKALVTVKNTTTGLSRMRASGEDGAYLHPALPVGEYRLTIEKVGFATYEQEGITLAVGQAAAQDVTLQIGTIATEVTIREDAP